MPNVFSYVKVVLENSSKERITVKQIKTNISNHSEDGYLSLSHNYKWVRADNSEIEISKNLWGFLDQAQVGNSYNSYQVVEIEDFSSPLFN